MSPTVTSPGPGGDTGTGRGATWLALFLATAVVALFVCTLYWRDALRDLYLATAYYVLLALVLTWARFGLAWLRATPLALLAFLRRHALGAASALAVAGVAFASLAPQPRVLADETNLLAVSRSLAASHTPLNHTMGKNYYGNFYPLATEVEKRPLLFPFLASLLHTVFGFDVRNLYLLNFFVLTGLLFGAYLALHRKLGALAAIVPVFLGAQPVVTLAATSAGYDLLATLLLFVFLVAAYGYLRDGAPEERFPFLLLTLVLLANTRHESILFLPLSLGLFWVFGYLPWRVLRHHLPLLATCLLFLLPWGWQKVLSAGTYENPAGVPLLSLDHLASHLEQLLRAQLDFSFAYPYNTLLHLCAAALLLWAFAAFLRRRDPFQERHRRAFAVLVVASLLVITALGLSHFLGNYSHPANARFFIPLAAAAALAVPLAACLRPRRLRASLVLLGLAAFLPWQGTAMDGRFMNTLTLTREARQSWAFLRARGSREVVVISDRPGMYAAFEYGAVDFPHANANPGLLHELERGLFRELYVFQRVAYATGLPRPETSLAGRYPLETLQETQLSESELLRISRVPRPRERRPAP